MKSKIIILALVILVVVAGWFYYQKITVRQSLSDITYKNASSDLIQVGLPYPGAVTGKEFKIIGKARGSWYFEASFPAEVLDKNNNSLFKGPAQAEGNWMTANFVPFSIDVKVPASYIGPAKIILKKDNPSGLPQNESSISFPITIEY